ncbi:MAG TPA: hypothetical protein VL084_13530 [Thermoanaerobaculia bacterium]|nr:hypothetical protein [Thermoanaerobaculia bacterium]
MSKQDIPAILSGLRAATPKLNETTDKANEAVRRIERLLSDELKLGVQGEVVISSSHKAPKLREVMSLAYERHRGAFRIVVKRSEGMTFVDERGHNDEALKEIENIPWAECPRHIKLEAFERLPDLLKQVSATAKDLLDRTDSTSQAVDDLLSALSIPDESLFNSIGSFFGGSSDGVKDPESGRASLKSGDVIPSKDAPPVTPKVLSVPSKKR